MVCINTQKAMIRGEGALCTLYPDPPLNNTTGWPTLKLYLFIRFSRSVLILTLLCTDPRTRDFHIKFYWTVLRVACPVHNTRHNVVQVNSTLLDVVITFPCTKASFVADTMSVWKPHHLYRHRVPALCTEACHFAAMTPAECPCSSVIMG